MDYADLKRWKQICYRLRSAPSENEYEDLVLFSELVRNVFPGDAPLRQQFEKDYKEFVDLRGKSDEEANQKRKAIIDNFRPIVASTERILSSGLITASLSDDSALASVDRVFFKSKLFYFSATMLVLAGVLLGLISFGHTWLSVSAFQRLEQTRKDLDATREEMDKLRGESDQVIAGFRDRLNKIFQEKQEEINQYSTSLKINLQQNVLPLATTEITEAASKIADEDLVQFRNAEIQKARTKFQSAADDRFAEWLAQAKEYLEDERSKVAAGINKAKNELDNLVLTANSSLDSFNQRAEAAFEGWRKRLEEGTSEVDRLTEQSSELNGRLGALRTELKGLQDSSSHALEVAGALTVGTSTGKLDLIGATLEQAALAVWVAVALPVTSLAIGSVALYRTGRRRTPHLRTANQ